MSQDNTSKRIEDAIYVALHGQGYSYQYRRKLIREAKSLIMELILEEKKKSYIAGGMEEILHRDEAREAVLGQLQKGKA